jgi:hypothetical protein
LIWKPIVKKYRDGKVKRTLKKGLKGLEMVKRERHKIIQIEYNFFHSVKDKFFFLKEILSIM